MFRKFLSSLALLAICLPTTAFAAKPPLELKPSSAWQVDYGEDRCRLVRKFGLGDEVVLVAFDRFGPSERFRLTLAGNPVRGPRNQPSNLSTRISSPDKSSTVSLRFGPDEDQQKLSFYYGSFGENPALIVSENAQLAPVAEANEASTKDKLDVESDGSDVISAARQKAIRYLEVSEPLRQTVILETGSMAGPLVALNVCVEDLMTTWGIDVEKHKTLSRKAVPTDNPGTWIVSGDYPSDMLKAGQPALVEFRLSVGVDGVPTACYIQSTTRPKEFDAAVCKSVMGRARFDPALDADGKPLQSYYRNTVRFQIPD